MKQTYMVLVYEKEFSNMGFMFDFKKHVWVIYDKNLLNTYNDAVERCKSTLTISLADIKYSIERLTGQFGKGIIQKDSNYPNNIFVRCVK